MKLRRGDTLSLTVWPRDRSGVTTDTDPGIPYNNLATASEIIFVIKNYATDADNVAISLKKKSLNEVEVVKSLNPRYPEDGMVDSIKIKIPSPETALFEIKNYVMGIEVTKIDGDKFEIGINTPLEIDQDVVHN